VTEQPRLLVHVISSLDVGGAETALLRLVAGLEGRSFRNHVVSLIAPGAVADRIRALGIPVESLEMRRGRASLRAVGRLARLLRREHPEVVQTWLYHADLLGLVAARLVGLKKVVWNVRSSDMDMSRYRWLSGATVRACACLSGHPVAVVVNSTAGRQVHDRLGYRPRRWEVIPNGVDTSVFQPDSIARMAVRRELHIPEEVGVVGMVARLDPMKDHATFFRAAKGIRRLRPDTRFILAGDGVVPENLSLEHDLVSLGIAGQTHLLGRRPDANRIMAALDIGTLSSAFGEGCPNVVPETMACGVPCVVTDVGDAASIVGNTGIVVPPRDPAALAEGWASLLRIDREARRRLGEEARKRVLEKFTVERMVNDYALLYRSLGFGALQGCL
jgi:glycosyltransferase involved in cell wall biosynthesis